MPLTALSCTDRQEARVWARWEFEADVVEWTGWENEERPLGSTEFEYLRKQSNADVPLTYLGICTQAEV